MKSTSFTLLSAMCFTAAFVTSAQAVKLADYNRVLNSDVETLSGASSPSNWTAIGADAFLDTISYLSPTHSLLLDDFDAGASSSWVSDPFAVSFGEVLRFGYYTEYFGISGNFSARVRFFDPNGVVVSELGDTVTGTIPPGVNSYEYRDVQVPVPFGATSAAIRISSGSSGSEGLANYDDLTIDENLVVNGRFETPNGGGTLPLDYFFGGNVSWAQPGDAPSGYSVVRIDDDDAGATSGLRSKAIAIGGAQDLTFGVLSRRTGMSGDAMLSLRFGDGVDPFGNLTNFTDFDGQHIDIPLTGDTVGFEEISHYLDTIPEGATHVDLRVGTENDPNTTGVMDFDDLFVVVTPEAPIVSALERLDCLNGPENEPLCGDPTASESDLDNDEDVDMADVAMAQIYYPTGSPPENLVINGDLETPTEEGDYALSWFRAAQGMFYTEEDAISPTHSIKQVDVWAYDGVTPSLQLNTGMRSQARPIPVGTSKIEVAWNWRYENLSERWDMVVAFGTCSDIFPECGGGEGPGNLQGFFSQYIVNPGEGTSDGWEFNVIQIDVPVHPTDVNEPVYFDIRIRSWGDSDAWGATGTMFADDFRVTPIP